MKATIEFDLNYDSGDCYDWETFLKMNKYRRFVEELENLIRSHKKYDGPFDLQHVEELLQEFVYSE